MIIIFFVLCSILCLSLLNKYLPRFFCDKIGWHLTPHAQGFDGCSSVGICPRCRVKVLKDGQGNWF